VAASPAEANGQRDLGASGREHGFPGHYHWVKVYVWEYRARLTEAEPEPMEFHRRFEVLPGSQAQVDWGDEGELQAATGPLSVSVSSFHMTLPYSRDPFCCYTASQDLGSLWDCHRRAFAHFGGVPATIVYDRTKTVVRRHVGRGQQTPLHPPWPRWTPPSPLGCHTAAPRSTAPTARSSPSWPGATGLPLARCPSTPMWCATGAPAGSPRTPVRLQY
jgi:transposase